MILTLADAETLVAAALERNNVSPENARSVAIALVAAEAAGQGGHGLRRVVSYCGQAKVGKANGRAMPVALRSRPGVLSIDVNNGFAYPAFDLAVEQLPAIVREQGIALAAFHRSHHAGVMGLTVERFAEQGLVAMMFANAPAAVAPWGGRKALFGTNPIAFAVPVEGADPLVIDLALSTVARGKVMAAQQKGQPIPADWALDPDGNPTTDANAAMAGTMMPLGGAKGAALALMVEILSAGLTGANYAYEASSLFDDKGPPPALGHMIIAIDPGASGGTNATARIAELAEEMAAQENVRIPGRRGLNLRRKALETGIEVDGDLVRDIEAL